MSIKVMSLLLMSVLVFVVFVFAEECNDFPEKLEKCEPYKCQFKHPFGGEMMEKQIVGEVNGKCLYTEQMPNGGKMECRYSEEQRKAVAQQYREIAKETNSGKDWGFKAKVDLSAGKVESEAYDTKGNKIESKDTLQECLNNGTCVISGYETSSSEGNIK